MEKHITFVGCKTQYCKDTIYPQIIYRLNEILLTIPEAFFSGRIWQGDFKIYMEAWITSNIQAILK